MTLNRFNWFCGTGVATGTLGMVCKLACGDLLSAFLFSACASMFVTLWIDGLCGLIAGDGDDT